MTAQERVPAESASSAQLNIRELEPGAKLDFLATILEPFDFDADRRDAVIDNFRKEILEIGNNRIILVGEVAGNPAATGQLVLRNADNDPELADGRRIARPCTLRP